MKIFSWNLHTHTCISFQLEGSVMMHHFHDPGFKFVVKGQFLYVCMYISLSGA